MAETEQQQAPEPAAPPLTHGDVAKSVFGNEYYGEVGKAEPEEKAPKPEDAHEGEVPVEEPAEGEPGETEKPEEETAPEDTGEMPIATVSELVEHLEADPTWFDSLKMSFNVDGMPTEATIKDLVDNYQIRGAAEHRFETAKAIAQKESETWAAKQQALDGRFQELAELIQVQEQTLEKDVRAIDPSLRDNDPAEWGARQLEFGQRRAHIDQVKAAAISKYNANAQARAEEFKTWKQKTQQEQNEVLLQKLPEWREPQRAETEKVQIADYLIRQGFQQSDLENLIDHRQVLMARKAMLYDQSRGKVDAAKKRVASVPKVMKPGAPKPTEQLASEKLQKLKSRLENSGTVDDAVAYRLAKRGAQRR